MTHKLTRTVLVTLWFLLASTLICMATIQDGFTAVMAEEGAETVLPGDNVISGDYDEYANRTMYVDGMGYKLCKSVKIFNPGNKLISDSDIEGAVEVKLFQSNGCIRKIKILRYAE